MTTKQPRLSRYSSTVFEIRLRSRRSSFDKNSPSSRAFTILIAALVPSPSTTLNGGINASPSTRNSVASDLYKSDATEFLVDGDALIPPFNVVDGLGTNAAINIVKAREDGEFLSKEDLRERSRISKTVLEYLDNHGCLDGMEEKNQLSLF